MGISIIGDFLNFYLSDIAVMLRGLVIAVIAFFPTPSV
jgi:hypothetical protein